MSIDEYVDWARNLGPEKTSPDATAEHLALLGLGLVGDAGEVADLLRKRLRDGTLDRDHLAYELGDVAYHWARLCAVTGITPSELLSRSRRNIEARLAKRAQGRAPQELTDPAQHKPTATDPSADPFPPASAGRVALPPRRC